MSSTPTLTEQFLQRLSTLPENITFQQIADVTLRDVDAARKWRKRPGFPPEVDRDGPRGARRFSRDLFGSFYVTTKLSADEAGTAPGPKAVDALGQIPDTPGLRLTAGEIATLRKVSLTAVHKATASPGFPEYVGVRSPWRTVKLHLERTPGDDVPEKDLLDLGVKRNTLEGLAEAGLVERTRQIRYRLTPTGRQKPPRAGTAQYLAWARLEERYPRPLPIDEILKGDVKRTNFAAMVSRGGAELADPVSYRLTDKGRANDPDEEGYGHREYEYDAAEVARYFRGDLQDDEQHLGPVTPDYLKRWAESVSDTCTRAQIADAARRAEQWVANGLNHDDAPKPLGRRRLPVGSAYEYDTRQIVDWLKGQFSVKAE